MSKHTAGTWKAEYTETGLCRIIANDGHGAIASIRLRTSKTNNIGERDANARLIAQAPAMYEALKRIQKDSMYALLHKQINKGVWENINNNLKSILEKIEE